MFVNTAPLHTFLYVYKMDFKEFRLPMNSAVVSSFQCLPCEIHIMYMTIKKERIRPLSQALNKGILQYMKKDTKNILAATCFVFMHIWEYAQEERVTSSN